MIPALLVAVTWQTEVSKGLLEAALTRYKSSSHYSCAIEYTSTRSPAGQRAATKDAVHLEFRRDGSAYSVSRLSSDSGTYRASRDLAGVDPYLAFDHHLTFWLGFRKKSLTNRLIPPDMKGPRFTFFEISPSHTAVFETYLGRGAPFQVTYTINTERSLIDSIAVCGPISPVRGKDSEPVFYSETVEFKNQQVHP